MIFLIWKQKGWDTIVLLRNCLKMFVIVILIIPISCYLVVIIIIFINDDNNHDNHSWTAKTSPLGLSTASRAMRTTTRMCPSCKNDMFAQILPALHFLNIFEHFWTFTKLRNLSCQVQKVSQICRSKLSTGISYRRSPYFIQIWISLKKFHSFPDMDKSQKLSDMDKAFKISHGARMLGLILLNS